ncbi:MAG TPA: glycosyltransferase family 4 protein [Rhodanobacteraceae bacterium]|nr:glycosyltransferase family 4 protein [Rhodanobacteraceae bacterium]
MRIWLPSIRARSGSDVYVERLADALRAHGAEPIVQWFPHAYQYFPWALCREPAPRNTDVINANSWIAFAFQRKPTPLVATALHCVAGRGYPEWKSLQQAFFHDHMVRRFERASFLAADAAVAISESTRKEVCQDFHVHNIRAIPLWVDVDDFSPGDFPIEGHQELTRILIIGNMSRRKGGDLIGPFCEALGGEFKVTVVAGLRGQALRVAAHGAKLQFKSGLTKAQLINAYRSTDIVVSLSRHEGFGYTALEGMSCGKPVVAFNASGLRDVVVHGQTGLLTPIGDVTAIAKACRLLRQQPETARTMGQHGRQRAITEFTADRAIDAHLRLYSELLSRGRSTC